MHSISQRKEEENHSANRDQTGHDGTEKNTPTNGKKVKKKFFKTLQGGASVKKPKQEEEHHFNLD